MDEDDRSNICYCKGKKSRGFMLSSALPEPVVIAGRLSIDGYWCFATNNELIDIDNSATKTIVARSFDDIVYLHCSIGDGVEGFRTGISLSCLEGVDRQYGFDGYRRKQPGYLNQAN